MNRFNTPISRMLFPDDPTPAGSIPRSPTGAPQGRIPKPRTTEDTYYLPNKYGSAKGADPRYPWGAAGPSMIPTQGSPPSSSQPPPDPTASAAGNINTGSQFNPFPLMGNQGVGGVMGGFGGRQMDPVAALVQQLNAVRMQILRNYIFGGR